MNTSKLIRVLAVTAVLASACGSAPATGNAPPASPSSPATTATPTATLPTATPTPTATTRLALVTLRGSNQLVVRDITDINHPKTVGNVGTVTELYQAEFVSATALTYADQNTSIIRVPLAGSPKTVVAKSAQAMLLTWSPDGSTLAYISNNPSKSELHFVAGGQNRVATSMPPFIGGCETQSCGVVSDFRLSYSQDGQLISLTQPWGGPNFRLWTSAGKLLKDNAGGIYEMSTWSGNNLYTVDSSGVVVMRDGIVVAPWLPGVRWLRPKGSPGGGQIVYGATDKSGWDHVYVVDTATKKVRELKKARTEPVFLTSRYIWYQGERACLATDACDGSLPVIANGKSYIYDLKDGTETESIITSVLDVWPHAG